MRCARVGGTPTGTLELYRTAGSSTGPAACPPARLRPSTLLGAAASTIDGCGEGSARSPSTPAAAAQPTSASPAHCPETVVCPPTGAVQRRASHHHHLLLHHKHHRLMRRSRRQTELTLAPLRRRGSTPKRWSPAQSIFLPSGLRAIASDGLDGSGLLLSRSPLPPFLHFSILLLGSPPLSNHSHFIVVVSPRHPQRKPRLLPLSLLSAIRTRAPRVALNERRPKLPPTIPPRRRMELSCRPPPVDSEPL